MTAVQRAGSVGPVKMGVYQHHQQNFFLDSPSISSARPMQNNNYIFSNDNSMNNISEFYKDTKVFITGATGFVGKALVEKLLRTCTDLNSIYLLMRPKRGMATEHRLKELFKNPVFNRVREKDPLVFDKVKIINGDVSMANLGISETDLTFLKDQMNIVFHSAATVKFNEDLKSAVTLNTLGTKRVVELCKEMKELKSFVHVSTAFSNSDKETIEETVYKPEVDPEAIMSCIDILPDKAIEELSKKILGKHPNTYTLTKAMAEYVVSENSSVIPTCVVRPSISLFNIEQLVVSHQSKGLPELIYSSFTAAWKEPYPGWVDNVSGITGILMECARGTIKSIICDDKCKMDLIPVDIVVNTIITAAWHTAAYRSNQMRVYNCTSSNINPITWKYFGELTHKYSLQYPSKYVTWYPGFTYRTSRLMHFLCATFFVTIPAMALDCILYCTKQKPMMLKISNKFYNALEAGKFFSCNQWDFQVCHMEGLVDAVACAEDGKSFEIDMGPSTGFEWDPYVKDFLLGIRQYVLKDDISSLEKAKVKLNRWWLEISHVVRTSVFVRMPTKSNRPSCVDCDHDFNIIHVPDVYLTMKMLGGTGFLGKVLIEKLLRCCDEIDTIYLLLRPKRGLDVELRLNDLIKGPIFNNLRESNPKALYKLQIVYGDISLPNLGLNTKDANILKENVDFVIHSAATVSFTENLKTSVTLNTLGTKRIMELCKEMKNLKSFVYVSTAYSNPFRKTVKEEIYEQKYNYNSVINLVENFSDEDVELLTKKIMDEHPNTYTLTKAMAEQVVSEYSSNFSCCIVRPAIITSSWKEPYEGWVDSYVGITGVFMECSRGTISSVVCNPECRMDLIPVDMVANTIIAAAWQTAINKMLRTGRKFWTAMDKIKYFTTREWNFETKNMEELAKAIKASPDNEKFDIDMTRANGFDWEKYIKKYILGIRVFLLKDELKSLPKAKARLTW
ncbi:unnamed protein product [Brassicogethes aeneus]|uniref:Fatty acyl-CoA reductase n=1 Tax=Brassicogethes aeneus TaxID=1431903 RepID=A0A9P0AVL5_BRAAE|nr:unnamed protein product [Brassicogethes aeneus]